MSNQELKPCPFCGGEADVYMGYTTDLVCCTRCPVHDLNREDWNTRADPNKKVTRFVLVDHATGYGRVIDVSEVSVELSYQDDGRTLKVFLTEGVSHADN